MTAPLRAARADCSPAAVALGRAVQGLREREGLSRRELARYAGIEHRTLVRVERGEEFPSFETLLAIVDVMVLSLVVLIEAFEHECCKQAAGQPYSQPGSDSPADGRRTAGIEGDAAGADAFGRGWSGST
jgi:transcriptional regulator with XRE-family HTH domain